MATFVKAGDQIIDLDAVTAATYAPSSATSHAGLRLLISGQWIEIEKAVAGAVWARFLTHANPEDMSGK